MKVLVIGSLNMDYTLYVQRFPRRGETISGMSKVREAGGKGANQAVAVARSGVPVAFMGCIGNDIDGCELSEILAREEIDLHLAKVNDVTGNATIIVDGGGENQIIIIEGANALLSANYIEQNEQLIKQADYIILQNEIADSINLQVLKMAHEHGVKIVFNPAPYRTLSAEYYPYIDYLTPNETELRSMCQNMEGDIPTCAQFIKKLGVKNVIVTLGTQGSYYLTDDAEGYIPAFKVQALDTVAAGDTFNGYLVSGLVRQMSLHDALVFASKASSLSVQRRGAIPSIPHYDEVIKL